MRQDFVTLDGISLINQWLFSLDYGCIILGTVLDTLLIIFQVAKPSLAQCWITCSWKRNVSWSCVLPTSIFFY